MSIKCRVENGAVHFEVYDSNDNFIMSADTEREAVYEMGLLLAGE